MIEIKSGTFYIYPVLKNALLILLFGSYCAFIQRGIPFQILNLFFALPVILLAILPSERRTRKIIFSEEGILVDGVHFSYSDLVFSLVRPGRSRYGESKKIEIELRFLSERQVHWFAATMREPDKEKKYALIEAIRKLIDAKTVDPASTGDVFREKKAIGRHFFIVLSVILLIWIGVQSSSLNTYDGNELNPYFWVPMMGGLLFFGLQYEILKRTSLPVFELAPSAEKRLKSGYLLFASLLGALGYVASLQGLYWANMNLGPQEDLSDEVMVKATEVRQGKGCRLDIYVKHPELTELLKLHDSCKRTYHYPVGKTFHIDFFRGSLGGYYFK